MIPCDAFVLVFPAKEAVIQLRTWRPHSQYPSFLRKREPRDFSRLPLDPRFRGDDGLSCPQDFLTASCARATALGKSDDRTDPLYLGRRRGRGGTWRNDLAGRQ